MSAPLRKDTLEIVHEDGTSEVAEADHFAFERAHLTLTRWQWVLGRPREVVVRRLVLRGTPPVLGVLTCADGPVGTGLVD